MLKFETSWRFEAPDSIPGWLIKRVFRTDWEIATQGNNRAVLEHFKDYFARAAGTTSGRVLRQAGRKRIWIDICVRPQRTPLCLLKPSVMAVKLSKRISKSGLIRELNGM
jgi:hypothetical protein